MTLAMPEKSFLLDTNVVSEMRRRRPDVRAMAYLASIREFYVCISVLTIGGLVRGADGMRRSDPVQAEGLTRWIGSVEESFRDRVIPIDDEVARLWGRLMAIRPRPVVDTLIAATAIVHGLTLVTRNVADVDDTGATIVDPWAA